MKIILSVDIGVVKRLISFYAWFATTIWRSLYLIWLFNFLFFLIWRCTPFRRSHRWSFWWYIWRIFRRC